MVTPVVHRQTDDSPYSRAQEYPQLANWRKVGHTHSTQANQHYQEEIAETITQQTATSKALSRITAALVIRSQYIHYTTHQGAIQYSYYQQQSRPPGQTTSQHHYQTVHELGHQIHDQ